MKGDNRPTREQLLDVILTRLKEYHLRDVAYHANVTEQTLRNWLSGHVKQPQLFKLIQVAEAIGLTIKAVAK